MKDQFQLVSKYSPQGDQPEAIKQLVAGIESGKRHQTLLGATGTGKTFTISNVIQEVNKPTLVIAHNKTLAGQLYSEFKEFFPNNAVEYFVSYYDYYQPEAYVPQTDTFIEKDASINDEIDKLRHSATSPLYLNVMMSSSLRVFRVFMVLGSPEEYRSMCFRCEQEWKKNEINCCVSLSIFNMNETILIFSVGLSVSEAMSLKFFLLHEMSIVYG